MADSSVSDRESNKQDEAQPGCRPISLLSFLKAENMRLRQAAAELSLDFKALREALKKNGSSNRVVTSLSAETASRMQINVGDCNSMSGHQ